MEPAIDWLVLTAANKAQARGYEAQLAARQRDGSLTAAKRWLVVPDPGDRRVGSGGSTFAVLFELARRLKRRSAPSFTELFANQRILIIHSGGDSRRLPAYAAQGKVFLPLPCDTRRGREAAMFDLVLEDLAAVPLPETGRVLIATGDVLLGVGRQSPNLDRPGVVGVAFAAEPSVGSRHGVYVADDAGNVTDFLQKPSEATAAERGAIDARGKVLVDMGLVALDPATIDRWLSMTGATVGPAGVDAGRGLLRAILDGVAPPIDLYEQVLIAAAGRPSLAEYLDTVIRTRDAAAAERSRRLLTPMYRALHGGPFRVAVVPASDFVHIGTSRELLKAVPRDARVRRGRPREWGRRGGQTCIYNSVARGRTSGRGTAVVEASCLPERTDLRGDNIIVGWPREARLPLRIPKGWGLVCLPVGARDWSVALFGVDDDCKTPRAAGGTLGGRPLDDHLRAWGVDPERVWHPVADQSFWTARLWSVGPIERVLARTLWMWGRGRPPRGWLGSARWSLADLITRVNHRRVIADRDELQRLDRLARLSERVSVDPWIAADGVTADLRRPAEARAALAQIASVGAAAEPLTRARLWRLGAAVRDRFDGLGKLPRVLPRGDLNHAAFAAVAEAVAGEIDLPSRARPAAIPGDQVVWVTTPVRLDFAGGWSDTPPICHELGGAVVNGAVTLNGQYPVQVMARLSDQLRIRISSVDLGASITLRDSAAVLDYGNPRDWAAIAKAALVLAGIAPSEPRASLLRWLTRLGGGLDLTMFSALPKGSGLGTSSVLGAALLACLGRVHGQSPEPRSLIRRTSLLEQMMSTAGGWQDQAGGILPGVKLLTTSPGRDQTPTVMPLPFDAGPGSELAARTLLYYTGYRRLAADILHGVVGRYLARDRRVLGVIYRLKACAMEMKAALAAGDVDGFARGVLTNWELKKEIDPGSTNARIEALFAPLTKYLTGYELPGAGGGGFLLMITRDEAATRRVRAMLTKRPPNSLARFYDVAIDLKGLSVSVL